MDDSSGMTVSHSQPPHPEDPVEGNPFSTDDPRHRVWAKATRAALSDLHALKQSYFEKRNLVDRREQHQSCLVDFIFGRFQIWAERGLSVVCSDQDARDYEQWLKSYMEAELKWWMEKHPNHFDSEYFLAALGKQLARACEYWIGNALKWVAEIEDQSEKEMASDEGQPADERPDKHKAGSPQKQIEAKSYKSAIGRNIDRFRKECGWSFDNLAQRTGIDKTSILDHVNKGTPARPATLKIYAEAFSKRLSRPVTVADLEA
jgi:hypothetical protein